MRGIGRTVAIVNFKTDPAKSHIDGRIGKSAIGTSTADATCAHAFGNPVRTAHAPHRD